MLRVDNIFGRGISISTPTTYRWGVELPLRSLLESGDEIIARQRRKRVSLTGHARWAPAAYAECPDGSGYTILLALVQKMLEHGPHNIKQAPGRFVSRGIVWRHRRDREVALSDQSMRTYAAFWRSGFSPSKGACTKIALNKHEKIRKMPRDETGEIAKLPQTPMFSFAGAYSSWWEAHRPAKVFYTNPCTNQGPRKSSYSNAPPFQPSPVVRRVLSPISA